MMFFVWHCRIGADMTAKDFVEVVKTQASDGAVAAVVSCLESPPGRKPSKRDSELSNWYKAISSAHQAMVQAIVTETAQQAVFSFLALLDGVAALGEGHQEGRLQLFYTKGKNQVLLNDLDHEKLHDLFNRNSALPDSKPAGGALKPYDVGEAASLMHKSVPGDGLEIHRLPQKHNLGLSTPGQDSDTAPAIALPKCEHRRMPPS
jgi:hypothetical protein